MHKPGCRRSQIGWLDTKFVSQILSSCLHRPKNERANALQTSGFCKTMPTILQRTSAFKSPDFTSSLWSPTGWWRRSLLPNANSTPKIKTRPPICFVCLPASREGRPTSSNQGGALETHFIFVRNAPESHLKKKNSSNLWKNYFFDRSPCDVLQLLA